MFAFFRPAAHQAPLPEEKIDSTYRRLRWQIFAGIFFGYAGYYLLRKNFSLAMPYLIDEGYSRGDLGLAMSAIAIAYGLSKFLMGLVSDRSNPRYFLPFGLLVSAGVMFIFGFAPWATSSVTMMFILLFINGWAQGMGWPPSGRTMVHWWSQKERGGVVSVWNVAHNVGGGLIGPLFLIGMGLFNDWHAAFYVPAAVALGVAVFAFITMRDTPQSVGLPPIEKYKNDYPEGYDRQPRRRIQSQRKSSLNTCCATKCSGTSPWPTSSSTCCVTAYWDWAPTYLKEAKHLRRRQDFVGLLLLRMGGHSGHAAGCGWMSDKIFRGNRGLTGMVFMALVTVATLVYWLNPAGKPDRGHDRAVLHRLPDLRPGDADRPAGAGTGTEVKPPVRQRALPVCSAIWVVRSRQVRRWATPLTTSAGTVVSCCWWALACCRWPSWRRRYGTNKSPVRVVKPSPDRLLTDSA